MTVLALVVFCLGPALHATGSSFGAPDIAATETFELRGVLSVGGIARFRICDPMAKQAAWLALGERYGDLAIVAYDAKRSAVVIDRSGTKLTLTLPKSTIHSAIGSDRVSALPPSVVPPAADFSRTLDIAAESRRHGIVRR